jgi:chromosome partitioning protein
LGVARSERSPGSYEFLLGLSRSTSACATTRSRPVGHAGQRQLAGAEIELIDLERREHRLADALTAPGNDARAAGTPSWSTARPRSAW